MDLYVSNVTNDLLLKNGDLYFTTDDSFAEVMRQRIKAYLLTVLGEYFLDDQVNPEIGVPYYQKLFADKEPTPKLADRIFRNALLSIDGVTEVKELKFRIDSSRREMIVNMKVRVSKDSITDFVSFELNLNSGEVI